MSSELVEPGSVSPDGGGDEPLVSRTMSGARPLVDRFVRDVMQAQVAAALFQRSSEPVRMGRYELRREVGTGGGGSVFEAWDPELEREVAIKLVTAPEPALRARALAEGQALAKLSHPNIVSVFDVGAVDDRVYLVMELIRGESLRAYAVKHRPRAILAAYRQCCDGLVAAHDAKLVHRDFKPDNALMGADGRARVIDFGLAVEDHAHQGMRGGTPRYMAPEQRRGETLTAATDQYAFAVSLRESLGTVPSWLARVLARAEAEQPSDRFPSMRALAAALARDPRTVWRRRALVVVPVALAAAGFWVGQERAPAQAPCANPAAALGGAWSPDQRAALAHRLAELRHPYVDSVSQRLLTSLQGYASRWQESHQHACLAHWRGEISATAYDRQQACLSGARTQLAELVELARRIEPTAVEGVVRAVPELADPAGCAEAAALAGVAPPAQAQEAAVAALDERLSRARVRVDAQVSELGAELRALVAEARRVGYPPAVARALLLAGTYDLQGGRYANAVEPLREATEVAFAARLYEVGVEAFARHAWLRSRQSATHDEAFSGAAPLSALASGLPPSGRFAEALLRNNLGSMYVAYDRPDLARVELGRSIELAAKVDGPGAIELANAMSNLALVTDDETIRRGLFDSQLVLLRDKLGADHPAALRVAINQAVESGGVTESRDELRELCPRVARLHPTLKTVIGDCWIDAGWLELITGSEAAALAAFGQGAEALGDTPWARLAQAFLAVSSGDPARARALLDASPLGERRARGHWYDLLYVASAELVRARIALARKDPAGRRSALARAVTDLTAAAQKQPSRSVTRRLAWATAQLEPTD
jgi:hypothetical protein